jgi:hypothetical protein
VDGSPSQAQHSQQLARNASVRWLRDPPRGTGYLSVASKAFAALPISLAEADPHPQQTTPSELLAASLAGYLGMHLALRMQQDDTPMRELIVDVDLTVSPWPSYETERARFSVRGRLLAGDGRTLDPDEFAAATESTLARLASSIGLRKELLELVETQLL